MPSKQRGFKRPRVTGGAAVGGTIRCQANSQASALRDGLGPGGAGRGQWGTKETLSEVWACADDGGGEGEQGLVPLVTAVEMRDLKPRHQTRRKAHRSANELRTCLGFLPSAWERAARWRASCHPETGRLSQLCTQGLVTSALSSPHS